MVMKKPPVTISLSGRVPGRASEPSRDGFGDGGRDGTFRGFWLGCLGFSRDEEYIGGRATSVDGQGAHTMPRRGQGGPRLRVVWLPPGSASCLLRTPSSLRKNKIFGFCFVQFREYFLCSFSETKNSRKQELALRHLVNRLVPENA